MKNKKVVTLLSILALVGTLLYRRLKWKIRLMKQAETFGLPVPSFMNNVYHGFMTQYLSRMKKHIDHSYHYRHNFYERVGKEIGNKCDSFQLVTPFWMPNGFLTRDPAVVKHVLKDDFEIWVKPLALRVWFKEFIGDGIFRINHGPNHPRDDQLWSFQRKTASRIFTRNIFTGHVYECLLNNTNKFISRFENELSGGGSEILISDFKPLVYEFTMDAIGEIGFGEELDSLSLREATPFSRAFDDVVHNVSLRGRFMSLTVFGRLFESERALHRSLDVLKKFSKDLIAKRRYEIVELGQTKGDILSMFLAAAPDIEENLLCDIVLSFMLAGRDTTACTLTFAFYLLAAHPQVQSKLIEEIRLAFEEIDENEGKDVDSQAQSQITLEMLKFLPYLDGVVFEVLRLFPPVPIELKQSTAPSTLPNGWTAPAGTVSVLDIFVMGRDSKRYANPGCFQPERWMSKGREVQSFDQFELPVFQSGPRICIGKDLALFEIKVLLVEFLRKFEISLPEPLNEEGAKLMYTDDVAKLPGGKTIYKAGVTLSFKGDLNLKVCRR